MLLPAQELAQLQADAVAATCDTPCVIERPTKTKDAYGTESQTLTVVSPENLLVGLAQPSAGQLSNYDYLIGSLAAWQVKMPVGTDVAAQDILTIGTLSLTVQVLLNPRSYPALLTVLASEVKS